MRNKSSAKAELKTRPTHHSPSRKTTAAGQSLEILEVARVGVMDYPEA
jgi:hypothetical protein